MGERLAGGHPSEAEIWMWDEGNEGELARHRIDIDEVEQVWWGGPVWVPNIKYRAGDWKMIGSTEAGRLLTIIIRYFEDQRLIRPITGWETTTGEKQRYLKGFR